MSSAVASTVTPVAALTIRGYLRCRKLQGDNCIFVRGQAFLAARRYAEAAAEFQRILDHPGIVFTDPVRVAARLQLGRTLALAGDKRKARAAKEDFLALWKEADQDIPLLEQAKADFEFCRLTPNSACATLSQNQILRACCHSSIV